LRPLEEGVGEPGTDISSSRIVVLEQFFCCCFCFLFFAASVAAACSFLQLLSLLNFCFYLCGHPITSLHSVGVRPLMPLFALTHVVRVQDPASEPNKLVKTAIFASRLLPSKSTNPLWMQLRVVSSNGGNCRGERKSKQRIALDKGGPN